MLRTGRRAWPIVLTALALLCLGLGTGCDGVERMGLDDTPPTGTSVSNPVDGSALNSAVINVRGRAEVGAEVKVYVNDVYAGTTVAATAVPYDGGLGRYTVERVDLGVEGVKTLRVVATDLYGNVADDPVLVSIELDTTPPPIAFETINPPADIIYNPDEDRWETGVPRVRLVGRTDTLAAGARVRYGINAFSPDSTYAFPAGAGLPDSLRFWVPMTSPTLTSANPDSEITYAVEAFDYAGNVSGVPVDIYWNAEGKDTVLTHIVIDEPLSFQDYIVGQSGMMVAVGYQAPVWANYVIGIRYFIGNDGLTDPINPQTPTTKPFTAWVWRPTIDATPRPGVLANDGMNSGAQYPEMDWLVLMLPNAVDISSNAHFPNKYFFVGLEWENRNNPPIGVDATVGEVDFTSWRLPWYPPWELLDTSDVMIEAIVSDIPAIAEARTATIRVGEIYHRTE